MLNSNFSYSGSSRRLRVALNTKGVDCQFVVAKQLSEAALAAVFNCFHPQGFVPALAAQAHAA